jgi:alkylhydroperoxidase family enzyme
VGRARRAAPGNLHRHVIDALTETQEFRDPGHVPTPPRPQTGFARGQLSPKSWPQLFPASTPRRDGKRAALAWVEAVTLVADGHVPDEVYEEAREHFSEKELVDLTTAVITINAWNRASIAFRATPPLQVARIAA